MKNFFLIVLTYFFIYLSVFVIGYRIIKGIIHDVDYLYSSVFTSASVISWNKIEANGNLNIKIEFYNKFLNKTNISNLITNKESKRIIKELNKGNINIYYTKLNNVYIDILRKPNYFNVFLRLFALSLIVFLFYTLTEKLIKKIRNKQKEDFGENLF